MAAVLSVNGCAEIENLLKFCEIPREKIRVEEVEEFTSPKVWLFCGTEEKKKSFLSEKMFNANLVRRSETRNIAIYFIS